MNFFTTKQKRDHAKSKTLIIFYLTIAIFTVIFTGSKHTFSPALTWRDMQYIVMMTARPEPLVDGEWIVNAVGRKGAY